MINPNLDVLDFEFNGQTYRHTSKKWQLQTNRHTTCNGYQWGWVEGAPGSLCWSDDPERSSRLRHAAARELVAVHNTWIDDQGPVGVRLARLDEARKRRVCELESHERAVADIRQAVTNIDSEIAILTAGGA